MISTLLIYIPLWASCLLICFGLTLMMVIRLMPELLTPEVRIKLLLMSCYAGLFFLLCTLQWIYALALVAFMFDKFGGSFRRWLEEPTDKSLRSACGWLLVGGILGVFESLDWFGKLLHPLGKVLSHPVISIGLTLGVLIVLCWSMLAGSKNKPQGA